MENSGARPVGDGGVEARLAAVVQDTYDAVIAKDMQGMITAWNGGAEHLYGYTGAEAVGNPISLIIPRDHQHEEETILERIGRGERIETYETERIRKDGVRVDVVLTVSPIRNPVLGIVGASIVARDVTAEKRRREAEAFLARFASGFNTSLDPQETATTIAETAVPELCELCVIDLLRPNGSIGAATVAARDPAVAAGLRRLRREAPVDPAGTHPVAQVIRSGESVVLRDLKRPEVQSAVAQSPAHAEFIAAWDYNSAVVVPLRSRGRLLGALSFLHVQNDRRYDDDDLALLEDLAQRAATAIDNAELYRDRSRVAATLQRSLRPESPPEIPGLELAVLFEPAGDGIDLGGDFYDLFSTGDGWLLLIGDVVGKGPEAAALTGQIRHTVRALGVPGSSPASILERVNSVLFEATTAGQFASAQLLELSSTGPGSMGVRIASAGHPPAVVSGAGGVRLFGGGTLLGIAAGADIATAAFDLASDDLLLLYTDGCLETGRVGGKRTPEALAERVARLMDEPLAPLLERLRDDALDRVSGRIEDDLVLVAMRPTA